MGQPHHVEPQVLRCDPLFETSHLQPQHQLVEAHGHLVASLVDVAGLRLGGEQADLVDQLAHVQAVEPVPALTRLEALHDRPAGRTMKLSRFMPVPP